MNKENDTVLITLTKLLEDERESIAQDRLAVTQREEGIAVLEGYVRDRRKILGLDVEGNGIEQSNEINIDLRQGEQLEVRPRDTKIPKIRDIEVLGDQIIHLLKYNTKRATIKGTLQSLHKAEMGLDEERELKFAMRSKHKIGQLYIAKINNSNKFAYSILPEWVGADGELKREHYPAAEDQPKKFKFITVVKSKE
jgi:hypothetical protein